jgi:HEAT repeat protein
VAALRAALEDADADIRKEAAIGLGGFGPAAKAAIPELRAAAKDHDGPARIAALRALWKIEGDKEAVLPALRADSQSKDGRTRVGAAWGVWEVSQDPAVLPVLVAGLRDQETGVCWDAVEALTVIGPAAKGIVPDLLALMQKRTEAASFFAGEALKIIDAEAAKKAGVR